MATTVASPLGELVRQGLEALGACDLGPAIQKAAASPTETIEQLAGGLLAAMGLEEVADDLDLKAISLLGAASVAGLKVIEAAEPGLHRLESALYALEDLLRRTAPVRS